MVGKEKPCLVVVYEDGENDVEMSNERESGLVFLELELYE